MSKRCIQRKAKIEKAIILRKFKYKGNSHAEEIAFNEIELENCLEWGSPNQEVSTEEIEQESFFEDIQYSLNEKLIQWY